VLVVDHTILEPDGHLVDGVPKTAAGVRRVYLDAETAELLRAARRGPLVIIGVQQRGLDVIAASSGPGAKPEPDRHLNGPVAPGRHAQPRSPGRAGEAGRTPSGTVPGGRRPPGTHRTRLLVGERIDPALVHSCGCRGAAGPAARCAR